MELRQSARRAGVQPLLSILVLVAVAALVLAGWQALTRTTAGAGVELPAKVTTVANVSGPDARDRNLQIAQSRYGTAELTHGH